MAKPTAMKYLFFQYSLVLAVCFTVIADDDGYLFVTNTGKQTIFRIEINGSSEDLHLQHHKNPIAVDYDPVTDRIFWTDVGLKQIRSRPLNGGTETVVYETHAAITDGIAVDAISRLIFYTDVTNKAIVVMSMNGTEHKTIINNGLDEPRDIEIDGMNGILYWTDWGRRPYIAKANYDGTGRHDIITTGLGWPNGIAVDLIGNKLYWCDSQTKKIEKSLLDGTERTVILNLRSSSHCFGLTLHNEFLYFTDWQKTSVMKVGTDGSGLTSIGPSNLGRLNDIQVMKSLFDEGLGSNTANACTYNKGGCSQICIPRPEGNKQCICADGLIMQKDGSCKSGPTNPIG